MIVVVFTVNLVSDVFILLTLVDILPVAAGRYKKVHVLRVILPEAVEDEPFCQEHCAF